MKKTAVLVVDMLNDFVTGALKCDRGLAIVPNVKKLLDAARKNGVDVIFCNDAHIKGVDHELKLWGDHAIAGTKGAEVIPELGPCDGDYTVPKRRYSGFSVPIWNCCLTNSASRECFSPGFIPICA